MSDVTGLRKHPQSWQRSEVRVVRTWVFRCAACNHTRELGYAKSRADGSLVCLWCLDRSAPKLRYCPECKRTLPAEMFKRAPSELGDAIAAAMGTVRGPTTECRDCHKPWERTTHDKACERCQKPFTSYRSDARYCSGKCRVAAHRS